MLHIFNEWSKEIDDRSKKLDVNYRPVNHNFLTEAKPTEVDMDIMVRKPLHSSSPMDLMVTRVSTASLCSQVGGSGAPLYWPSTLPVA